MKAKLNKLLIWFLWRVDEWMCARLSAAFRREKELMLKRQLKRRDAWKN